MQNTNLDAIVVVIATLVIYWLICRLTKRKAWPRVRARFLARRPRPRRPVAFQAEVLPLASKKLSQNPRGLRCRRQRGGCKARRRKRCNGAHR